MQIQRSNPTERFVILPNATVQNGGLSFTARGILAYLVSLPEGARESIKTLASKSQEGRTAVAKAMKELETAGHLRRVVGQVRPGLLGTELIVSDVPMVDQPGPVIVEPSAVDSSNAGQKDLKNLGSKNLPTQTPGAPAAPVGSGPVDETRSGKALAGLAAIDSRLHLTADDVTRLTPLADEWFARGVDERRFAAVLTLGLPEAISHPAAFLRRRLFDKMPAVPAVGAPHAPSQPRKHECPGCDRAVASEGLCKACSALDDTKPTVSGPRTDWRQLGRQFGADSFALKM